MIVRGECPICENQSTFEASHDWLRDALICTSCENGSLPRERALALILNRERPNWRNLDIHECSPSPRGISIKLESQCASYVGSNYFPGKKLGVEINGVRNENIEQSSFENGAFDIVIALDVAEHVFNPAKMFSDIYRTLRDGGIFLSTFPIHKSQVEATAQRASLDELGQIRHLEAPEFHGNPVSDQGSLVTYDYGYEIHQEIGNWALFSIEIVRFAAPEQGVLGEYTEVIICRKLKSSNSPTWT